MPDTKITPKPTIAPVKKKVWTHNDLVKAQRGIKFDNVMRQPDRKPIVPPAATKAQVKRET